MQIKLITQLLTSMSKLAAVQAPLTQACKYMVDYSIWSMEMELHGFGLAS